MWIEKLNSGKFRAVERYTDPLTGKERKMSVTMEKNTAATRKVAAEALRAKAEAMYAADPSKQEITLQELLDKYIAYQKSVGIQGNTYRRNRITCQSAIDLIGPEMSAHKLSARIITSKLVAADIQNGTRNNYLVRLKAMIRWGYDNDYLENIDYLRKVKRFPFEAIARRVGHHDSRITKDIYFHVTEGLKQKDDTQMEKIKIL